jgi:hypothetical protein
MCGVCGVVRLLARSVALVERHTGFQINRCAIFWNDEEKVGWTDALRTIALVLGERFMDDGSGMLRFCYGVWW